MANRPMSERPADRRRIHRKGDGHRASGFRRDELGHVFEAFAAGKPCQGLAPTASGASGSAWRSSRKMIEMHSGRISALSEGRDRGSTFEIELPRHTRLSRRRPAASGQTRERGTPIAASSSPPCLSAIAGSALHSPWSRIIPPHAPCARRRLLQRRTLPRAERLPRWPRHPEIAGREKDRFVISDIGLPDGSGYHDPAWRSLRKVSA